MKKIYIVVFLLACLCMSNRLVAQAPVISSYTPASGPVGTSVTITGSNFSTSGNVVFFGATKATVISASATQLVVTVPSGASSLPISVTANSLTGYSTLPFIVTFASKKSTYSPSDFDNPAAIDNGAGTNPRMSVAGDFDGDGLVDLAVLNTTTSPAVGSITIYLNNPTVPGTFTAAQTYSTGGTAGIFLAAADLNGDGKLDLVTANSTSGNVSVLLNKSTGTGSANINFATAVLLTTGATQPYSVAINDIDGDGKPDIAACGSSNAVYVFQNKTLSTGSAIFSAGVSFTAGSSSAISNFVAMGDMDGDGKPELVVSNGTVSNSTGLEFYIFRNAMTGSGTIATASFATPVSFIAATFNPICNGLALADLDGDGKLDVVVDNTHLTSISVFRNNSTAAGSFTFDTAVNFTTLANGTYVLPVISDIDGDGKPDIVINANGTTFLSVFHNSFTSGSISTTSFSRTDLPNAGTSPGYPTIADFDGDGKPDIVIGSTLSTGTKFLVFHNNPSLPVIASVSPLSGTIGSTVTINGNYGFSPVASNNTVYFGATKATVTAATNNKLTVTVPSGASYLPVTVLNTTVPTRGLISFSATPFNTIFTSLNSISPADFDAKSDLNVTGTGPVQILTGDLDGDGLPDMVVANQTTRSVSIFIHNNPSSSYTGAYNATPSSTISVTTGTTQPILIALGDLDGDGKLDLVVTGALVGTTNTSYVYPTSTASSGSLFGSPIAVTSAGIPFGLAIGDLDNDGLPDIVISSGAASSVSLIKNTSSNTSTAGVSAQTLSFATRVDFSPGLSAQGLGVAIADIDGDGKPEIIVTNNSSSAGQVAILRNVIAAPGTAFSSTNGTSFVTATSGANTLLSGSIAGGGPNNLSVADIDGDGKIDIAVALRTGSGIAVFRNNSTVNSFSFDPVITYATGSTPKSVSVADMDGDGKPDLVVGNNGTSKVSVLRNISTTGATLATTSFATKVDYTAGSGVGVVAVQDIDGDSKPDILVPNQTSSTVSILHNDPSVPVLTTSAGTTTFQSNVAQTPVAIDGSLTVTETNGLTLSSASVSLTSNFTATEDVLAFTNSGSAAMGNIAGSYNSTTGTLTLTSAGSTATLAQFQAALAAVTYANTNASPNTANRQITFSVNDGYMNSNTAAKIVQIVLSGSTYYSKATGDLSSTGTYGSLPDGTGTSPTDFNGSGANATYQLANRSTYTLTSDLSIGTTLNIPASSTLDLAGNTLTINTLNGSGSLSGSTTSSLVLNGTAASLSFTSGKEELNNLTLGSSASLTMSSKLNISSKGMVRLGTGAALNTNNTLTLRSDASGTAQIGQLGSGASITGTATVERYIADKRSWRLISPSVYSTQTINTAWQEGAGGNGTDPNPGYGTLIVGSTTANGFDVTGTSGSLLAYNGTAFNSVPNTNTTMLSLNPAYFLFSIGSRGVNPSSTGSHSSTILRASGLLVTGSQTANIAAAGYTLVGNPYAAPVDFAHVGRSASVPDQFYAWDINLGSYGGYVLVSNSGGSYSSVPASPSGLNNIIPSGGAIFLQSDGTNAGTLTINESSKATAAGSGNFSSFSTSVQTNPHNFRVNLTDQASHLIDGVMASFAPAYSDKVDGGDASKMSNFYENIALIRSGKLLTLERRSDITARDTIFIQLSGVNTATYHLQINPDEFNEPGMIAFLEDAYLKTRTRLDLGQVNNLAFSTVADSASFRNRFRITFTTASALLSFVEVSGSAPGKQVLLKWQVNGEEYVQAYTVEKWNGASYSPIMTIPANLAGTYSAVDQALLPGDNTYRISAKDFFGNVMYSQKLDMKISHAGASVVAYPNPATQKQINLSFDGLPAGNYNITVMNAFGQIVQKNSMNYNGTTANKLLAADYITGVYTVTIQSQGFNQSIKVIIQ